MKQEIREDILYWFDGEYFDEIEKYFIKVGKETTIANSWQSDLEFTQFILPSVMYELIEKYNFNYEQYTKDYLKEHSNYLKLNDGVIIQFNIDEEE